MSVRALLTIVVAVSLIAVLAGGVGLVLSGGTLPRFRSSLHQQTKSLLSEMPLPGREPPETPEFAVEVRVESSDRKNRLYFDITEAHGYYVETLRIQFWRVVTDPVTGAERKYRPLEEYLNVYIKEDETLTHFFELVPAELVLFGGSIGKTGEWHAVITMYDRARETNPVPLPPRPRL